MRVESATDSLKHTIQISCYIRHSRESSQFMHQIPFSQSHILKAPLWFFTQFTNANGSKSTGVLMLVCKIMLNKTNHIQMLSADESWDSRKASVKLYNSYAEFFLARQQIEHKFIL